MIAQDIINPDITALSPDDTIANARNIFMESCVCQIPIVEGDSLQGLLPVDLLRMKEHEQALIQSFQGEFKPAYVPADMHILNVFRPASELDLSVIPVVDANNSYLGAFSLTDLTHHFAALYSFREAGGIFTLSIPYKNYDISEISRIVESNNTKILSIYTELNEEGSVVYLTAKVNTLDLKHLEATFERYNYDIQVHHTTGSEDTDLKERYELLMRYLDL
jgi:predicted transcriptional regulator